MRTGGPPLYTDKKLIYSQKVSGLEFTTHSLVHLNFSPLLTKKNNKYKKVKTSIYFIRIQGRGGKKMGKHLIRPKPIITKVLQLRIPTCYEVRN